ncbi:MAG: hypothetical protein QNJ42_13230 [Crocosphaera sp.]|nr:hypothetical protein [Crocosphaera sp.]
MRFIQFLLRQRTHTNRGQALGIVLLVGLLMAGAATMMLTQSQAKQKFVNDSLETAKIRNAAEVAQTRLKSLLIQYPTLLLYPPDFWETALLNLDYSTEAREFVNLTRLCQSNTEWNKTTQMLLPYAQAEDINIDNNTFFRLINVTHRDNNQAIITIEAKNKQGITANLKAEVSYEFHYLEGNVPALWTTSETRIRSEFDGDVWLNDCNSKRDSIRIAQPLKNQAKYVGYKSPELPDLSKIINRIPKSHVIKLDRNYEGETSFPRSQDSPTKNIKGYTIYEYVIEKFETNQPIEIKTVVNGKPIMVIFNTKQGIKKGEITHTCGNSSNCSAENLILINHATNMNDKMCLVTDELSAFIFSPNAGVGFISKNTRASEISGSIWTKELILNRVCGKEINLSSTLTFEQIIRDFQILSPYPKITEVSEFKMVDNTVVESEFDNRVRVEPWPSLAPDNSFPVSIDDEFDNSYP